MTVSEDEEPEDDEEEEADEEDEQLESEAMVATSSLVSSSSWLTPLIRSDPRMMMTSILLGWKKFWFHVSTTLATFTSFAFLIRVLMYLLTKMAAKPS